MDAGTGAGAGVSASAAPPPIPLDTAERQAVAEAIMAAFLSGTDADFNTLLEAVRPQAILNS
jgi:hypothetical protein